MNTQAGSGVRQLWLVVFWIVMAFQVTILSTTLQIELLGRLANVLTLGIFGLCALGVLVRKHSERVLFFYCFPMLLLVTGYSVNILRSGHIEAMSHVGLLLPWLAALSVPFMRGFDWRRFWKFYYVFMLAVSMIGLLEYAAVFFGWISPTTIETDKGSFLKGFATIFFELDNKEANNRMYGVFWEPGTYAMHLLPAMIYGMVQRRFFGLLVFATCLVLTGSLGGFLGLGIMLAVLCYWNAWQRSASAAMWVISLGVLVLLIVGPFAYDYGMTLYQEKGVSATAREDNLSVFFLRFWDIVFEAPLGMDLSGEALSAFEGGDQIYAGSNFAIGNALTLGGLMAMLGYVLFLATNVFCWLQGLLLRRQDRLVACVIVSFPAMLTFAVQRMTVFDSALYSFLYAAPMLALLRGEALTRQETLPLLRSS
jgi:hypothetical protein